MSGSTTIPAGYLAGVASLLINGDAWNVVDNLEWQVSGYKLETLKGQTAVEGPSAMPMEGYISATIRDRRDRPVAQFMGATGLSVQVQQANGKSVAGQGMWCVEVGPVATKEGTLNIRFEGPDVTESLAQ